MWVLVAPKRPGRAALIAVTAEFGNSAVMQERWDLSSENPQSTERVDKAALALALEASWDVRTAYGGVVRFGNPAFGQCYPTSRVVQWFYAEYEIAKAEVWTGTSIEHHFWNIRSADESAEWLDLSWQQFPPGSFVRRYDVLDRNKLDDSSATTERCALLLRRALSHLGLR